DSVYVGCGDSRLTRPVASGGGVLGCSPQIALRHGAGAQKARLVLAFYPGCKSFWPILRHGYKASPKQPLVQNGCLQITGYLAMLASYWGGRQVVAGYWVEGWQLVVVNVAILHCRYNEGWGSSRVPRSRRVKIHCRLSRVQCRLCDSLGLAASRLHGPEGTHEVHPQARRRPDEL